MSLSESTRIYDPIDLLPSLTFFATVFIHKQWTLGLFWDDFPPEDILHHCQQYTIFFERSTFTSKNYFRWEFWDASEKGYAACIIDKQLLTTKPKFF